MGEDEQLDAMTSQWNQVVENLSHLNEGLKIFYKKVGRDVDELEGKVQMVDSKLGCPMRMMEDCIMVWHGITVVHGKVLEMMKLSSEVTGKVEDAEK